MLLFHEGLPRSGKSYEAMVRHIIPALQQGREVFAYIEGIDHQKVSQAAELELDLVQKLLHYITKEQVPEVYKHVRDNSLVVLDEAQDFWPTGRQKLSAEMTTFITQHGHRGLDILLMGQDMRDVHPLWRRRVSQKVVFNKLDAVGQEHRYSATVHKAVVPERFEKVTSVVGKYDVKYFGTYKSHVSDSTNTGNYKDSRANVFNKWQFKYGMPLMALGLVWAIWTLYRFFVPAGPSVPFVPGATPAASAPAGVPGGAPGVMTVAPQPAPPKPFVDQLNDRYRVRLAMLWHRDGVTRGVLEWWDGDRVRERLTFQEVTDLGARLEVKGTLVKVSSSWATQWPAPERNGNVMGFVSPTMPPTAGK